MAWISKQTAYETVAHGDTSYITDAIRQRFEQEIFPRYPEKRGGLIPLLHAVQDSYGWLPAQAIEEIAEMVGVTPVQVQDTASFYEEFFLQPRGRYTIWLCQSVSCEIMGATPLIAALENKLGIRVGQTTEDGKFTLMHVECLGACGVAPCGIAWRADEDGQCRHQLLEKLSVDNLDRVLDELP